MALVDAVKERQKAKDAANKQVKLGKTIWVGDPKEGFLDRYEKGEQLGNAGQYGVTYRCKEKATGNFYAVKFLNKNRFYRIDPKFRPRYMASMSNEINILQTVDHPNIIKLKETFEDKTLLYLVMEECKGGELFKRIVAKQRYSEADASQVIKELLSALDYMHSPDNGRIVHCDLKPDNILFLDKSDKSPVKIIDFGMSKVLAPLETLDVLCGTPYYTAPEVIQDRKYDHLCDMWSLGVIIFVMVFGYPPFYVDPNQYGNNERNAIYKKICHKGFTPKIMKTSVHGYGPWFPDHIPSSDAVRDLIGKLLTPKHRKRYTAQEALTHEWITNNAALSDKAHITRHMMTRLMHFNNVCHFKLIITKIFRNQFYKMRPEHFHQLEQLFVEYDTDGDGVLTFKEFTNAMAKSDVNIDEQYLKKVFEGLMAPQQLEQQKEDPKDDEKDPKEDPKDDAKEDAKEDLNDDPKDEPVANGTNEANESNEVQESNETDEKDEAKDTAEKPQVVAPNEDEKEEHNPLEVGKGGIKFSDLLNALVYDYLIACDERLYDAFRKLDDDNDGYITAEELKQKLKQIDPLGEFEQAIKIIEESSLDNNGLIDYEEFLCKLHPKYNETPSWMPVAMQQMKSIAFIKKDQFKSKSKSKKTSKKDKKKTKKSKKSSEQ